MISVIMPTMWIGSYYNEMLKQFNDHPLVGEIIIIDNDPDISDPSVLALSKVKHYPQSQNIYVNPAWNLGAKLAQYDKLCLYSDDVKFGMGIIDRIEEYITPQFGLIGFKGECVWETTHILYDDGKKAMLNVTNQPNSVYATCLFVNKGSYHEIPEDLKIYWGDTYLFYKNRHEGKHNLEIDKVQVLTLLSTTSSMEEFKPITTVEKELSKKYLEPLGFDMPPDVIIDVGAQTWKIT